MVETQSLVQPATQLVCYHCGDDVTDNGVLHNEKKFCCTGCKIVYEILEENNLCQYYSLDTNPGISPEISNNSRFEYLDDSAIQKRLHDFSDGVTSTITFYLPTMHCSSCVWLLENLYKLNSGIHSSRADFLKKTLAVRYSEHTTTLRSIVELLASLGYEPQINLDAIEEKITTDINTSLYYKIGVAGFVFGNVMLLSFPEYLSTGEIDAHLRIVFGYINLLLSLPIFFYCSADYFRSALAGLKKKIINIDVPIALGIFLLFTRSAYEILTQTGAGFVDSLSGLLFFLLAGRLFQNKTYDRLNFERNYKSYFPIAIIVKKNGKESTVPVSNLNVGDKIVVRNNEIIPADGMLLAGDGAIDYSFVTGESRTVPKVLGEIIFAGGRQTGSAIELEITKEVSQSYLTQLWNNAVLTQKDYSRLTTLSNTVSKYFTSIILLLATASALYWLPKDVAKAINAFTGILIVACPCALAISTPFTFGNTLRIFGRNKFYLKNSSVIESLSKIDTVVFDKTGTITQAKTSSVQFIGAPLSDQEQAMVSVLVRNSSHPLSRMLYAAFPSSQKFYISDFSEKANEGIAAVFDGAEVKLGSKKFVDENIAVSTEVESEDMYSTKVYVSINNKVRGYFVFANVYRKGLADVVQKLRTMFSLAVISGDNDGEKENVQEYFSSSASLHFNQSPKEKLAFIQSLQSTGKKVLMLGDGLNDAGALMQSDIGIAITEDTNTFSPACDAILDAEMFSRLPDFIRFAKTSMRVVIFSFALSFLYNLFGLYFATQGLLSPIVAAILMPLSSISIVVFTTVTTQLLAKRKGLL